MSYSKINKPLSREAVFTLNFDKAFSKFLSNYSDKQHILKKNKASILKQCRKKFKDEDILKMESFDAQARILGVLKQTVYSCAAIPAGFIGNNDSFEADVLNQQNGEVSDLNVVARNVFRYIERGTEVDATRLDIKKGLALVEKALTKKRDSKLTTALRVEFQNMLTTIASRLEKQSGKEQASIGSAPISADDEKQYEILISNLLAAYTFLDPHEDARKILSIPQRIEGLGWRTIEYRVDGLDLSPQTGLLSKLIRDEDRIYAYGLTPVDLSSQAQRQLLLMGTIYSTGQGSTLSNLHKFDPKHSIGEAYDWGKVEKWLKSQNTKVKVTGHSQGGSSAMFVAASYPDHIAQADCLNPPALCTATLNRLNPNWLKIPKQNRPHINVYTQAGDPIFFLENGFLEGTRIFRIISGIERCSNLNPILPRFFQKALEAHLHHFVGRESSLILELDVKQESFTHGREFLGDMKGAASWVLFPFLYVDLMMELALRNAKLWCLEHLPKALTNPATLIGFIPYYALKFALILTLFVLQTTLLVSALLLTAVGSGMKIGVSSALGLSHKPQLEEEVPSRSLAYA